MAKELHPQRSPQPELVTVVTRVTGANDAHPTITEGKGGIYTVTRTGEGVYRYTFNVNRSNFVGFTFGFGATTAADMKGYTATHAALVTSGARYYIDVSIWNSSFAAADVIAAQYLTVVFYFRETSRQP